MTTTEGAVPDLLPCPFCAAPGFVLLAGYGFKIKCTDTECTVETPIKTHRHQVESLWNRRAALAPQVQTALLGDPAVPAVSAPAAQGVGSCPVAWLVTGGRTFVDRAFITEQAANKSIEERKDGARKVPLCAAPDSLSIDAVDAARYRWLRQWAGRQADFPLTDDPTSPEDMDAQIDAALSQGDAP